MLIAPSSTRRSSTLRLIGMTLLLVAITGCPRRKFEIHMRIAETGQIQRTHMAWEEDRGRLSTDERTNEAATAAYGPGERLSEGRFRFEGTFAQQIPCDLVFNQWRNRGQVARSSTKMGTVVYYLERMPGPTQLEVIRTAEELVDLYVKAMTAYVTSLPQVQQDEKMKQAIERCFQQEIRDDLLELALIYWRMSSLQENMPEEELNIRLGGHLVESGALALEGFSQGRLDSFDPVFRLQAMRMSAALGYAEGNEQPAWIADIFDPADLSERWAKALEMIGITQEAFEEKLRNVIVFGETPLEGTLTWHTDAPCVQTNGQWSREDQTIVWTDIGSVNQSLLPDMLYASMEFPDTAYQRRYLGTTLHDCDLTDYNAWYNDLSPSRRAEWDAFVESLPPETVRQNALFHFHFSDDLPADEDENDDKPVKGATLILAAWQAQDRTHLPKVDRN